MFTMKRRHLSLFALRVAQMWRKSGQEGTMTGMASFHVGTKQRRFGIDLGKQGMMHAIIMRFVCFSMGDIMRGGFLGVWWCSRTLVPHLGAWSCSRRRYSIVLSGLGKSSRLGRQRGKRAL